MTISLLSVKSSLQNKEGELDNKLRQIREAKSLTQGDLARLLGVSRQTVNAVETNKYDPSLPLALRMAKLFHCNVTEIFIDDWEPTKE